MPLPLCYGQIIWAEFTDRNGIKKKRPAIVMSPTESIAATGELTAIAISTRVTDPRPTNEIALPFHPSGHAITGLYKPCVAVLDWATVIQVKDVLRIIGEIPEPHMRVIQFKADMLLYPN